jgi:hypothetical protein
MRRMLVHQHRRRITLKQLRHYQQVNLLLLAVESLLEDVVLAQSVARSTMRPLCKTISIRTWRRKRGRKTPDFTHTRTCGRNAEWKLEEEGKSAYKIGLGKPEASEKVPVETVLIALNKISMKPTLIQQGLRSTLRRTQGSSGLAKGRYRRRKA